jgi:four helix bundle protein
MKEEEKPYNIRHRCYYFSKEVVLFVKECTYDRVFYSIFDQLIRCATSIGANSVEGKAGSTRKNWKNYYKSSQKYFQTTDAQDKLRD